MAVSRSLDKCYRCHQLGHWAQDCTNIVTDQKPQFSLADDIFPEKMCSCGRGYCIIRTSNSQRNPGRKYYKCYQCQFFQWCDGLGFSSPHLSPNSPLENFKPSFLLHNLNPKGRNPNPNCSYYSHLQNPNLNSPLWNLNSNPDSLAQSPNLKPISTSWNHNSDHNPLLQNLNLNSNPTSPLWKPKPNCNSKPSSPSQSPNLNPVSPSWNSNPNSQSWCPNPNSQSCSPNPNSLLDPNCNSSSQNLNYNTSPRAEFGCQQQFATPSNNDKIGRRNGGHYDLSTYCFCRAGPCPVLTTKNGRNAGRKFVACPIMKGQGTCGFFEWRDELNSASFSSSPLRNDFVNPSKREV